MTMSLSLPLSSSRGYPSWRSRILPLVFLIFSAPACSSQSAQADALGPAPGDGSAKNPGDRLAGAGKAALTPDMAAPYFSEGDAAAAAERFALRDHQAARTQFAAYLESPAGRALDKPDRARVRLLMALSDTHLREWQRAAQGFEAALADLPVIADYIRYQAARARYFAHDLDAALEHARAVAPSSIVGADAELLVGDILRGTQAHAEMAAHYEKYLADRPDGIRMSEVRYRLGQAYEALDRPPGDAMVHYRQVTIESPLSSWADKAKKRLDALLPQVSAEARKAHQTLSADELITRGMAYYNAMRNPLSEADFEAALEAPGITVETRCVAAYHRAQSVFKARDRKRAAPLFDEAIDACAKAKNVDLEVKAAYQAGRSYAFIKERETALKRYQHAEGVDPKHTYVDDARLRQAEEYADMNDADKTEKTLASIPVRYPEGDMRAEALWRLGWRAYQDGDYEKAIGWLEKQIQTMPIDDNYWAEGQAQYWLGRSHAHLGDEAASVAAYKDAIIRYPLSYYALLALNRLREENPREFEAIVETIRTPPADFRAEDPPFQFKARAEYASPGFARALEFMRLGLGDPAEAELRRLDLAIPPGKDRLEDPDAIEKVWATAFLYDRARRYSQSHWPTRWHILDYKRSWPVGHALARWRIAYPRGYWSLIDEHAEKHGFPTELLMGIMREESGFDPLRESYANAIGLTQLIFPTAERFAKGTDIDVTRANLRDPEKNVTIGSHFLGFLWDKWKGQIMLVPPSYNAGENAVARWLGDRGELPADEFLETIKADQPRRYSKRVLSSYFVYTFLESGRIPEVSNVIPLSVLPEEARKRAKKKAADKRAAAKKAAKKKPAKSKRR